MITPKLQRRLNGANSKLLSHFTGKTIIEEATTLTTSPDLNKEIRRRRLRWADHILRLDESRMVRRAVAEQLLMGQQGGLLMDAPQGLQLDALTQLAPQKSDWTPGGSLVESLEKSLENWTTLVVDDALELELQLSGPTLVDDVATAVSSRYAE